MRFTLTVLALGFLASVMAKFQGGCWSAGGENLCPVYFPLSDLYEGHETNMLRQDFGEGYEHAEKVYCDRSQDPPKIFGSCSIDQKMSHDLGEKELGRVYCVSLDLSFAES